MSSHLDENGSVNMVDVGNKSVTRRTAVAIGKVIMNKDAFEILKGGRSKKGEIITTAKIAGIMAAKKTYDLIPLCHNIRIERVNVDISFMNNDYTCIIKSEVTGSDKTGFEMEALTAVTVSCLTIYDMLKSVDREITITDIYLLEKSGGKSGEFKRKI